VIHSLYDKISKNPLNSISRIIILWRQETKRILHPLLAGKFNEYYRLWARNYDLEYLRVEAEDNLRKNLL